MRSMPAIRPFPMPPTGRQAGFAIQLRDGFELATGLSLIFVEN
jgi:hypothetical protein